MWKKLLNRDKKTHGTVNTPIRLKQRYNESHKNQSKNISIQLFLILKWLPTIVQRISKFKFKGRVQESRH